MKGLKNVRNRRTDALTHVGWDQLESMLAVYYRGQGYKVDHCGTGASGSQFDGGIDLKLYKDDAYIVVQCKHWNAKQVTHNAVHELIGVMITQGATGGILVTSGEFSRYAIESAAKQGHVQLVDGDELRGMLGPIPELAPMSGVVAGSRSVVAGMASTVGERLLSAAEDRIRHGGNPPRGRPRRGVFATTLGAGLGLLALKLVFALVIVLILTSTIKSVIGSLPGSVGGSVVQPRQQTPLPQPQATAPGGVLQQVGPARQPEVIDHYTGTTSEDRPRGMPAYHPPTAEDIRASRRQADEAARIIEATTPEM